MSITFTIEGDGVPFSTVEAGAARNAVFGAGRRQAQARTPVQVTAARAAMIAALERQFLAQPNEFHLTGGSTVVLDAAMARLGMITEDYRKPQKPRGRQYGVTAAMIAAWGLGDGESPEVTAYQGAVERYLAAAADNPTGIPAHKIRGDDRWQITPAEITAALGAYRTTTGAGAPEPQLFWWPHWIAFLERAAHLAGIRVCN